MELVFLSATFQTVELVVLLSCIVQNVILDLLYLLLEIFVLPVL